MSDDKTVSRSAALQLLTLAPIAIGAFAALGAEAEAAGTIDPKSAAYQTHPNGAKKCSGCSLFVPAKTNAAKNPGSCQLVKGPISPSGWCKYFAAKSP